MAFQLTEAAITRVTNIKNHEGWDGRWLRLAVRGGGCSGFSYIMDFVDEPVDTDKRFEFNDVSVCIDIKSYLFLAGVTLDYESDLIRSRFLFVNPDAATTCSCGESFSV